jgi:hypothetical protein
MNRRVVGASQIVAMFWCRQKFFMASSSPPRRISVNSRVFLLDEQEEFYLTSLCHSLVLIYFHSIFSHLFLNIDQLQRQFRNAPGVVIKLV